MKPNKLKSKLNQEKLEFFIDSAGIIQGPTQGNNDNAFAKIPRNLVQSSKNIYDSSLDYCKNANGRDDNDSSNDGGTRYTYPECRFLSGKDLNIKRNKMEKISNIKSMDSDNIKKLGEENDDSEAFKEMFNPGSLDNVTGFLGVSMRSLVYAPETSEFSEHLTSTLKTVAKTELKKLWNNCVMMKDNGDFLNLCKITGKIYDQRQSAAMRLFSDILIHDSILDVIDINYVKDGRSGNALSSKIIIS